MHKLLSTKLNASPNSPYNQPISLQFKRYFYWIVLFWCLKKQPYSCSICIQADLIGIVHLVERFLVWLLSFLCGNLTTNHYFHHAQMILNNIPLFPTEPYLFIMWYYSKFFVYFFVYTERKEGYNQTDGCWFEEGCDSILLWPREYLVSVRIVYMYTPSAVIVTGKSPLGARH